MRISDWSSDVCSSDLRKARAFGLTVPGWVKTSLAPGSPTAERLLTRAGLMDDLEALGFAIAGYGCTVCIGNSGPLNPDVEAAMPTGPVAPVALFSGNRTSPGRSDERHVGKECVWTCRSRWLPCPITQKTQQQTTQK